MSRQTLIPSALSTMSISSFEVLPKQVRGKFSRQRVALVSFLISLSDFLKNQYVNFFCRREQAQNCREKHNNLA